MDALDLAVREFDPQDGFWSPLDELIGQVFASPNPRVYYNAIFNLFERFPSDDGNGVFWSALHGMEAVGDYEELLLQYSRRHPSLMTQTMLRRIFNSGQHRIGKVEIAELIDVQARP